MGHWATGSNPNELRTAFLASIQQVSHRFAVIASWQVSESIGEYRVS